MRPSLLLAAILLILASSTPGPSGGAQEIDFTKAGAEGLEHLKALVHLDTSNPPGNESRAAAYLAEALRAAGLEPRILESEPGRGSLLVRNRVRLSRDVVFLAEADEEAGGAKGMDWLLERHADLFDAELALNEGGRVIRRDGKPRYVAVQTTEKIYQDFTVVAHGTAGHSSIPAGDNPIDRLVRALDRIGALAFAPRLNPVTRAFFTGLVSALPADLSGCVSRLEDPQAGPRCLEALSAAPNFNAMLRTTCTPTILKAGYKENVIP